MTLTQKELIEKIDSAEIPLEKPKKKQRKPRSIYADQIIFMFTLLVMGWWAYGFRAVFICFLSVVCCVIIDMLGCQLTKKEYTFKDMSTVAYGLALGLMLPASVPFYIVIFGDFMAIGVKHIFGGKDNYIFNPTAVSIAFLIICYPSIMLLYPKYGIQLPAFDDISNIALSSGIESYFVKQGAIPNLSGLEILMGKFNGAIGTTHILVLIVCGVCLMFRHSISIAATSAGLGSLILLSHIFPIIESVQDSIILQLVGGFLLFGFIFLANDPQTLPKTIFGRLLYGISLGCLIFIFRRFAKVEGIFVFALLVTNALSLYLDRMGASIIKTSKNIWVYLRSSLGSFERFSQNAKEGKAVDLAATQEIEVELTNYNMPPIDGKVTKIKRKKKFSFAEIKKQILANLEKKEKEDKIQNIESDYDEKTDNISMEEPSEKEQTADEILDELYNQIDDDMDIKIALSEKDKEEENSDG